MNKANTNVCRASVKVFLPGHALSEMERTQPEPTCVADYSVTSERDQKVMVEREHNVSLLIRDHTFI